MITFFSYNSVFFIRLETIPHLILLLKGAAWRMWASLKKLLAS